MNGNVSFELLVLNAVEAGDIKCLKEAVAAGADIHGMEDISPLTRAVELRCHKIVETLLELGADPDIGGIITPLTQAAISGDDKLIRMLINSGADVNAPSEGSGRALMAAAANGHLNIARQLISAGADVNARDDDGQTALEIAMTARQADMVKFLSEFASKEEKESIARRLHLLRERKKEPAAPAPAKPKPSSELDEMLIAAVDQQDANAVQELAAEGANVNQIIDGYTLLARACSCRPSDLSVIKVLLDAGADPDAGEQSKPLHFASGSGNADVVQALLNAGADIDTRNIYGQTPLMYAASNGDVEIIKTLLNAGADPNAVDDDGENALKCAIDGCRREAREILEPLTSDVESATKPWRREDSPDSLEMRFLAAAEGGDAEYVRRFIDEGVALDVADESYDTALHLAASEGHLDIVEELLKAGMPLEVPGCRDFTPLLTAVAHGQTEVVRRLLDLGASVKKPDGNDRRSLYVACSSTMRLEIVDMLLAAGADPNAQDSIGMTPLHAIAQWGMSAEGKGPDAIGRLVEAGADLTIRDKSGWTPFMMAAMHADLPIVRKLVESGADPYAVDKKGENSLQLAEHWGDPEIRAYLKNVMGH